MIKELPIPVQLGDCIDDTPNHPWIIVSIKRDFYFLYKKGDQLLFFCQILHHMFSSQFTIRFFGGFLPSAFIYPYKVGLSLFATYPMK